MDNIDNPDNPFFVVRWEPVPREEGGQFIENYIVSITITSRVLTRNRRQTPNTTRMEVQRNVTSYTFNGVAKYSQFDVQVFANLGSLGVRPVTGVTTIKSGPARKLIIYNISYYVSYFAAPSEPADFQAEDVGITDLTLHWGAPLSPNGVVVQYNVSIPHVHL